MRKAAKWKSALPRQVGSLLRRPIPARPCSSRNKLKCAKAPCLREVSHTLVHFGEKEWHRNRSSDACTFPQIALTDASLNHILSFHFVVGIKCSSRRTLPGCILTISDTSHQPFATSTPLIGFNVTRRIIVPTYGSFTAD